MSRSKPAAYSPVTPGGFKMEPLYWLLLTVPLALAMPLVTESKVAHFLAACVASDDEGEHCQRSRAAPANEMRQPGSVPPSWLEPGRFRCRPQPADSYLIRNHIHVRTSASPVRNSYIPWHDRCEPRKLTLRKTAARICANKVSAL